MEPERKIEKNLRAYAKKRRADAGDPLKLHPATRRLLQGEIARNAPKPSSEESVTLGEMFQRRWALAAGFALVLCFAAALFLPALISPQKKASGIAAMDKIEPISAPANSELAKLADAKDSARLELAAAPAPVTVASGNAVAAPALGRLAEVADASTTTQNFQNYDTRAQNSFKNTAVPARAAAVLANFQVQQNGNALRVVDADGSVYDGSFQPEKSVAQNAPAEVDRQKLSASHAEQQAAQNNFFRVSGMNQTLKQNVVFTGNLLANPAASAKQKQSQKGGFGGSQSQWALTNQSPWSDSRIAGTAVVADTNSIEINAVPQSP